ncbi:MAG TPA: DUF1730 domain-containing protein [Clostridiales bacterium]|nr:MAG: Epoxyqueuosine reductase [Firmicutes bacterium ADurb.Bin262]HOU09607.1 DUF1730 domain-containing protein [Clostridiales bacterium]HQK73579.1 DUF1730 domain-containing protein [Clostridiales bacterium]
MDERIDAVLEQTLPWRGVCAFDAVSGRLRANSAARRLPGNPHSVIAAVFPYSLEDSRYEGADLARFACVADYHKAVLDRLEAAAAGLKALYPDEDFACFCDHSPIDEPFAAAATGLGFVGKNNLLIHPLFGSWVVIGEIVTGMALEPSAVQAGGCGSCRLCEEACPAGILNSRPFDKKRCLSYIAQCKGALDPREQCALAAGGSAWGCDICQRVCPHNLRAVKQPLREFAESFMPAASDGLRASDRVYAGRGAAVVERNLRLLENADGNSSV